MSSEGVKKEVVLSMTPMSARIMAGSGKDVIDCLGEIFGASMPTPRPIKYY